MSHGTFLFFLQFLYTGHCDIDEADPLELLAIGKLLTLSVCVCVCVCCVCVCCVWWGVVEKDLFFQHLWPSANRFGVKRLVTLLELFLSKKVEKSTDKSTRKSDFDVIGLLLTAQTHNANQLANFCLHFISSSTLSSLSLSLSCIL